MSDLPGQVHQRGGTAVATRQEDDPYALDQTMVTLPTFYIAQYTSKAFKRKLVGFGDLFVAIGAEDANPRVLAEGKEPLSDPVRFYVHRIESGFDYVEDPDNPKDKTLGRLGGTFQEALQYAGGDPRRVWQKFGYRITVPAYPVLPLRLFTSGMSTKAGRWMNTQIGMMRQEGRRPLDQAFQLQSRPTSNSSGDFAVAVISLADVKAKDAAADQELVQSHVDLLSSVQVQDADYAETETQPVATNAPSLA